MKDTRYVEIMNQTINEVLDEYAMPVYCESSRRTHESIHELNLTVRASLLWETVILRLRTETIDVIRAVFVA